MPKISVTEMYLKITDALYVEKNGSWLSLHAFIVQKIVPCASPPALPIHTHHTGDANGVLVIT